MASLHVIVLAAGRGIRMRSERPKALHEICGEPMLVHILREAARLRPQRIHVVVSKDGAEVAKLAREHGAAPVVQQRQNGTGGAAGVGLAKVPSAAAALVLFGDLPLIDAAALRRMARLAGSGRLALRTMRPPDPTGYGRVLRGDSGAITGLVTHTAASPAQRRIGEVDAGGMAFPAAWGKAAAANLEPQQGDRELVLTDLVAKAAEEGLRPCSVEVDAAEGLGVNTPTQLIHAQSLLGERKLALLAAKGVLFAEPGTVALRGRLRAGRDSFIDRNVLIEGDVSLAAGAAIGPNCVVRNTSLAAGASLLAFSHADGARLGRDASAGPFARLRPGAKLGPGSKVGNFVEVKAAELGAGAKASHLSYLGDAKVGEGANIGAGTVFCNYDGERKYRTTVGKGAFVGSGSMLVAPVEIGADALVGAGSVITKDVPAGSLALSRSQQRSVRRSKKAADRSKRKK